TRWLVRADEHDGSPHLDGGHPHTGARVITHATEAAAYLVPFLAMTAASLLSRAFSSGGDEPLYALRPAAGLGALAGFHRWYRRLQWPVSPLAIAGGLGVAALWLALDRWLPSSSAAARAAAAGAPAAVPLIAARAASAILLVPAVEELAFRGFLARRIVAAD